MTMHETGARSTRTMDRRSDGGGNKWLWALLALLVIAAVVIFGFFALGGDVDAESEGQFDVDVQTPRSDLDVDAPDVDVEPPDVDVEAEPGSIDVDDADAEAEVGSN